MHAIERRPVITAAELILASTNIEVIDTAASPKVAQKRLKGTVLTQAIQRHKNEQTSYTADGAITIRSGTHLLSKTSAGAFTLAAPTAAQAGTRLRIISTTAYAHVITSTDKLNDGVTGGAKDTATFAAFAGAAIELEAVGLAWSVVSKNLVTIEAV